MGKKSFGTGLLCIPFGSNNVCILDLLLYFLLTVGYMVTNLVLDSILSESEVPQLHWSWNTITLHGQRLMV